MRKMAQKEPQGLFFPKIATNMSLNAEKATQKALHAKHPRPNQKTSFKTGV